MVREIVSGQYIIGLVYKEEVVLVDGISKRIVGRHQLFKDTNKRVKISADDKYLVIASWREGLKIINLVENNVLEVPATPMTYLDFHLNNDMICLGGNKQLGYEMVNLVTGEISKTSSKYVRIIECPDFYLAFKFDTKQGHVDILEKTNYKKKWGFNWNCLALKSASFYEKSCILTSTTGEAVRVDFLNETILKMNIDFNCFSIDACYLNDNTFSILVSEFQGGDESAFLRVNKDFSLSEVMALYSPISRFTILNNYLYDKRGTIFDLTSGEIVGEL